jgi:hypothetical protein
LLQIAIAKYFSLCYNDYVKFLRRIYPMNKTAKKLIALLLSVLMIASVSSVAAYAEGEDTNIYFDATSWEGATVIYCHLWAVGEDAFFNWQSKKEACKKVADKDGIFSYDLSKLEGLDFDAKDYCVIFSANTGSQTYDITLGASCLGDTLKAVDEMIENPMDSEKKAFSATWEKNSANFGPHRAITSIGNIVGTSFCPHETAEEVLGNWLVNYYNSTFMDVEACLANACTEFAITADKYAAIMDYVNAKAAEDTDVDAIDAMLKKVLNITDDTQDTTVPEETTAPVEETTAPVEETTVPAEETTAPAEETTAPAEETTAPAEETTVPAEETTVPAEETTVPAEETTVPAEETTAPAATESTSSSETTTAPSSTKADDKKTVAPAKKAELKKNPAKIAAKAKAVKAKKVAKKALTLKLITVKNAKGKVTYKVVKKDKKKVIALTKKGKIKVKKGAKKGTYKMIVKVTVKGNQTYKPTKKNVKITVKVK